MQYQIENFKVRVEDKNTLSEIIEKKFHIKKFSFQILNRSIDAREKSEIFYVYRLVIETEEQLKGKNVKPYIYKECSVPYPEWKDELPPVIVGFGPAGMFAALYLARCHANPIIIERGAPIEQRLQDVLDFMNHKHLNPNSNVQFGEGGAGAFSDGKLNTNIKSPLIRWVLKEFYRHGAHEDILYDSMPHVGTDVLRDVVKSIREEIIFLGGRFYFNTTFQTLSYETDSVIVKTQNESFQTRHVLLGIGHSAKDTIRHLYQNLGVQMEPKAFSMGVRVEHLQAKINEAQYGSFKDMLPPAYYKLSTHVNQRGIYTFCMCPGGYVLASASEEGSIVTNGMSNQKREGVNANSALLVDVKPIDFNFDVLQGLAYQEKYERKAYQIAKDGRAPANLMKEFMKDEIAKELRSIQTTYPHGLKFCNLQDCLPDFVIEGLKNGIEQFDKKMKGFYDPDAILIGVETRSSCPIRMIRNENRQANLSYVYPIGEGAGYAGGITSAAVDGLKTALFISGCTDMGMDRKNKE